MVFFFSFSFLAFHTLQIYFHSPRQVLTAINHRSNQWYVKLSRSSFEMLSKCKDFLRITSSRLFQHACCYSLGRPKEKKKKNGKRLWLTKYNTAHLEKQWQKWMQGVAKGCFELFMERQYSLHVMPFIFHEQSASKAFGTLHQKPETHALSQLLTC